MHSSFKNTTHCQSSTPLVVSVKTEAYRPKFPSSFAPPTSGQSAISWPSQGEESRIPSKGTQQAKGPTNPNTHLQPNHRWSPHQPAGSAPHSPIHSLPSSWSSLQSRPHLSPLHTHMPSVISSCFSLDPLCTQPTRAFKSPLLPRFLWSFSSTAIVPNSICKPDCQMDPPKVQTSLHHP